MRLFTVLGPTHSGKTTLVEALGNLDGRSTKFDVNEAVSLRKFTYIGDEWAAIDIAGGADNLAFAGPALAASDAAVLCLPPEADAAVLAAPYLRLIEESGVPCFMFVNRMDAATDRVRDIVAALQAYCGHSIILRQVPIREGGAVVGAVDLISERAWKYQEGEPSALIELPDSMLEREQEARTELLDSLADFDDELLEQLIEDRAPPAEEVYNLAAQTVSHGDVIEAFLGAASHNNGVTRLMKSLRHEAPTWQTAAARIGGDDALAVSALADIKKHLGKVTVIRALADGIGGGSQLGGETIGSVTDLDTKTQIAALSAGQVGLAVKSDHLAIGRLLTASGAADLPDWAQGRPASNRQMVHPVNERDEVRLSTALHRLEEIDPGLTLAQHETSGKAIMQCQGNLHMRRLTDKLSGDFGIEIEAEPVPAEFRETISKGTEKHYRHRKQSGGAGQFADVVIDVKPLPRGAGFAFDEVVKGGAVPRNYIPAVQHGAADALAAGPKGHPVVDIGVTLKDGKHHSVDSSDFAFRTAGRSAVKEALDELGTVLLQPIMKVEIHTPSVYAGGLAPTISSLKGQVLGFEAHATAAGWDTFSALMPAASQEELTRSLASATRGTAWAAVEFDHYEETYETEKSLTPA